MVEQVNGMGRDRRSHRAALFLVCTIHFKTRGLMAAGGLTGVEGGGYGKEKRELE